MSDSINHRGDGFAGVSQARLEANWRAIEIELDAPRPTRIERFLRRVGVPAHASRLVVATPALRRSWYLAILGAVLIALTASDSDAPRQSVLLFLMTAPLVGVLGVAMAYGPAADPAHELHVTAPLPGLRVLAIRTLVVMALSSTVIVLLAVLDPTTRPFAAAWLLPAVAVAATALALMTWTTPRRAASIAALAWCAIVVVSQVGTDPLVVFTWVGQAAAATAAIAAIATTIRRREAFDHLVVAA